MQLWNGKEIGFHDVTKITSMKNILVTAAVVLSLISCGDGSTTNETTSDTTANTGLTTDTSTSTNLNPADTLGINRDTSRTDRTRITNPSDTLKRRDTTGR